MFSSDIPMILWYTIPSFTLVSIELQTQDPSFHDGWNMFHAGVESTTYWPGGGE